MKLRVRKQSSRERRETARALETQQREEAQSILQHLQRSASMASDRSSSDCEDSGGDLRQQPILQSANSSSAIALDRVKCSICLEGVIGDVLRGRLPVCPHLFCSPCIRSWAKVNNVCPMCKRAFRVIVIEKMETGQVVEKIRIPAKAQPVWYSDEPPDYALSGAVSSAPIGEDPPLSPSSSAPSSSSAAISRRSAASAPAMPPHRSSSPSVSTPPSSLAAPLSPPLVIDICTPVDSTRRRTASALDEPLSPDLCESDESQGARRRAAGSSRSSVQPRAAQKVTKRARLDTAHAQHFLLDLSNTDAASDSDDRDPIDLVSQEPHPRQAIPPPGAGSSGRVFVASTPSPPPLSSASDGIALIPDSPVQPLPHHSTPASPPAKSRAGEDAVREFVPETPPRRQRLRR